MTDPFAAPGHGPADPPGYCIERTSAGFVWTRLADCHVEGPFPTRHDAVLSAEWDRTRADRHR